MSQEHNNHNNNNYINHHGGGDDINREEYPAPNLEDLAMASVLLPLARANLLDYLYASGLPLRPIQLGGAGVGGVGAVGGGGADLDIDGIASILANSLYDLRPVKTVIDEKGMSAISEKTFTAMLAEELKINTVCGIWQDEFEEGEPIKILPCNHAFKVDAIERWLTTEKAECPICRFSLSSKEVICRPLSSDVANDDDDHVNGAGGGGGEAMVVDDAQDDDHIPQINENHIAARLADNIHNRSHREDPVRAVYAGAYASRQSISMPINQLIQSRRNMIDNIARASGGARMMASRWPAAAAAAPVAAAAAAEPAAHPQYINNYYIGNIGNIINAEPVNPVEDYNNRYNNVYYNNDNDNDNNNYNNDHISNRERDDIQEAIRRSLEEQ